MFVGDSGGQMMSAERLQSARVESEKRRVAISRVYADRELRTMHFHHPEPERALRRFLALVSFNNGKVALGPKAGRPDAVLDHLREMRTRLLALAEEMLQDPPPWRSPVPEELADLARCPEAVAAAERRAAALRAAADALAEEIDEAPGWFSGDNRPGNAIMQAIDAYAEEQGLGPAKVSKLLSSILDGLPDLVALRPFYATAKAVSDRRRQRRKRSR